MSQLQDYFETMEFENYFIRLVHQSDLHDYFNLIDRNRKRLETFFAGTVALTKNIEATKIHLDDIISKQTIGNFYSFVVIEKNSGNIIGSIQIKSLDWNIPKGEIGYYIDEAYEGKGITTKAVAKIIEYGFQNLKLAKLFLRANSENKGSVKVAEKNGFEVEGKLRKDYKTTSGVLVDLTYYGLLNPEL
ncbi:MAG: GNAT family N-acetyltransferase [Chitinophagales bacterium]